MNPLSFHTVSDLLKKYLLKIMSEELFSPFRLVGGTNLSLRYGHRLSVDIDLFTDYEYGSLDFQLYEDYFKREFNYFDKPDPTNIVGFGRSYYIGENIRECIKIDLMYTDPFLYPIDCMTGIRFASVKDILVMKLHAVKLGARKKDFWDLHLLMEEFGIKEMLELYKEKYPWEDLQDLCKKLIDFRDINDDFDPVCLKNKDWDIIKMDLVEGMETYLKDKFLD